MADYSWKDWLWDMRTPEEVRMDLSDEELMQSKTRVPNTKPSRSGDQPPKTRTPSTGPSRNIKQSQEGSSHKRGLSVTCLETGEVFKSATAASRAGFGDQSAILKATRSGALVKGHHFYKTNEGRPPDDFFQKSHKEAVRCVETGKVYESLADAARATDRASTSNIRRVTRTGGRAGGYHWEYVDESKNVERKDKNIQRPAREGVSVTCAETGEVYPTIKAAAEAIGCSPSNVYEALGTKTAARGFHWYRTDEPCPEEFRPKQKVAVKCVETGVVYSSYKEAAEAYSLTPANFFQAERHGYKVGGLHFERVDGQKGGVPRDNSRVGKGFSLESMSARASDASKNGQVLGEGSRAVVGRDEI